MQIYLFFDSKNSKFCCEKHFFLPNFSNKNLIRKNYLFEFDNRKISDQ